VGGALAAGRNRTADAADRTPVGRAVEVGREARAAAAAGRRAGPDGPEAHKGRGREQGARVGHRAQGRVAPAADRMGRRGRS